MSESTKRATILPRSVTQRTRTDAYVNLLLAVDDYREIY